MRDTVPFLIKPSTASVMKMMKSATSLCALVMPNVRSQSDKGKSENV